ncbi:uncharacterized protein LOC142239880 [Haematobia irritans]|uniref:uncharacterized protein LOC142239880 n=1 Tax=Haematobia irritans TaxID=7368 RepID=UPI003F508153
MDNMDIDLLDTDLKNLLSSWNLAHLYSLLHENKINLEILKILQQHHIQRIFDGRPIGEHALFEHKLEQWKSSLNKNRNLSYYTQNYEDVDTVAQPMHLNKQQVFTVHDILNNTKSGSMIFKYYAEHRILHDEQRYLLINTIANFLQEKGIEYNVQQCAALEDEICTIFASEKKVNLCLNFVFYQM